MKIIKICLVLFTLYNVTASDKTYKIPQKFFGSPLSKMLGIIVIEFYSAETISVTITRAADDNMSNIFQSGLINEVLYDTKDHILVRLETYEAIRKRFLRYYNVIVVDNYESFKKIRAQMNPTTFDFTGFYTIVVTDPHKNNTKVVQDILEDCFEMYIINVNVITFHPDDKEKAYMYTYFPYTSEHCAVVKPVIYGVFENETFTKNKIIFPNKVSNFHRCNLTIGTFQYPPYMTLTPHGNGSYYYDGFEGIVSRVLGQRLNFSLILETSPDRWGIISGENSTGVSGKLLRGEVNFTVGSFATSFTHYGNLTSTISYVGTPMLVIIPPGKPYSPMEKLFLPMKYIIWSCLAACFIIAAGVVLVASFTKPAKRAFIFGPKTNHPYMNTVNVFLGGCIPVCPRRNFARFILILWILTSLVIRTCYQGALFGVLKDSKNTTTLDTFPKMKKAGYKIYGIENIRKYFQDTELSSMFTGIKATDVEAYRLKTTNPDFKGAVPQNAISVAYVAGQLAKENVSLHTSKEQIVILYTCIFLRKFSYLTKPFDTQLWKYTESGLINRWLSIFYDKKFLKTPRDIGVPQAMKINQLSGIFLVYIIMIALSIVVFILELLSKRIRVLRQVFEFLN